MVCNSRGRWLWPLLSPPPGEGSRDRAVSARRSKTDGEKKLLIASLASMSSVFLCYTNKWENFSQAGPQALGIRARKHLPPLPARSGSG